MNVKNFNLLAESLGYAETKSIISNRVYAGSWQGFPVSLSLGVASLGNLANGVPVLTLYLPQNEQTEKMTNEYNPKNIGSVLAKALKKGKITVQSKKDRIYFIIRNYKKVDYDERIRELFEEIKLVFREQGVYANYICPACKQGNCDAMFFNEGEALMPIHNACKSKILEQTTQNYKDAESSSNNFRGLLGLLLGGFVGALPAMLGIVLLNTQFLILYALIPLASFYGFKYLGGKPGILPVILIILWSLCQVFVILVLSLYFYLDQFYTIPEIVEGLFEMELDFIFEQTWFGFVSVGLGLIPAISEGLKTADRKSEFLAKTIGHAVPYVPYTTLTNHSFESEEQPIVVEAKQEEL